MKKNLVGDLGYYTSPLLEGINIKHGFFTRKGGVSKGAYSSLNVKQSGDEVAAVKENRRRMCKALGTDPDELIFANELGHNNKALLIGKDEAGRDIPGLDALVTRGHEIPLALSVADCVPVVFAAKDKSIAGVIHVSWRSLNAGIVEKTFELADGQIKQFVAALGPCIAVESYQVQADFIEALRPRFRKFLKKIGANNYFDLLAATESEMKRLGILEIDAAGIDTYTNTNEFYSYRKEGECGRFGAIVSL